MYYPVPSRKIPESSGKGIDKITDAMTFTSLVTAMGAYAVVRSPIGQTVINFLLAANGGGSEGGEKGKG